MPELSSSRHEDFAEELAAIGAKRAEFKRLRAEAAKEAEAVIPAAIQAGISIAEIGRLTNMTRQAVYNLVGHPTKLRDHG